jgi:hypothetical protein
VNYPVPRAQGVGTPPQKIYGDSSLRQRPQGVLAFNINCLLAPTKMEAYGNTIYVVNEGTLISRGEAPIKRAPNKLDNAIMSVKHLIIDITPSRISCIINHIATIDIPQGAANADGESTCYHMVGQGYLDGSTKMGVFLDSSKTAICNRNNFSIMSTSLRVLKILYKGSKLKPSFYLADVYIEWR